MFLFVSILSKQLKKEPTTPSWLNQHADPSTPILKKKENTTEDSRHIPWFHQQLLPWEGRAGLSHIIPIHDFIFWFHIIWTQGNILLRKTKTTLFTICQQHLHASHYSSHFTYSISLTSPPSPITLWDRHYDFILQKKWNTNQFK